MRYPQIKAITQVLDDNSKPDRRKVFTTWLSS